MAAAHDWDGPMSVMQVRPAHPQSYEAVFHASEVPAFFLPLRHPARQELHDELTPPRLERAIGVVYRPQTELQSHYFHAILPRQFDEYVWFDETRAVRPVTEEGAQRLPRAHPFAAGTRFTCFGLRAGAGGAQLPATSAAADPSRAPARFRPARPRLPGRLGGARVHPGSGRGGVELAASGSRGKGGEAAGSVWVRSLADEAQADAFGLIDASRERN